MKTGDLVVSSNPDFRYGSIGLVMEEEEYDGAVGTWVWFFDDHSQWHWYSFNERFEVDVISESR